MLSAQTNSELDLKLLGILMRLKVRFLVLRDRQRQIDTFGLSQTPAQHLDRTGKFQRREAGLRCKRQIGFVNRIRTDQKAVAELAFRKPGQSPGHGRFPGRRRS